MKTLEKLTIGDCFTLGKDSELPLSTPTEGFKEMQVIKGDTLQVKFISPTNGYICKHLESGRLVKCPPGLNIVSRKHKVKKVGDGFEIKCPKALRDGVEPLIDLCISQNGTLYICCEEDDGLSQIIIQPENVDIFINTLQKLHKSMEK